MSYQHAVWPTPVPVGRITEAWEDGFRPKDYGGKRHDQTAWEAYMRTKEMVQVQHWYWLHYGMVPHGVIWG